MEDSQFQPQQPGMPNMENPSTIGGNPSYNDSTSQTGAPNGQFSTYGAGEMPPPIPPKKHTWVYILVVGIILAAIVGLGAVYYFYQSSQSEDKAYVMLEGNENVQDYEDYLKNYPNGPHAEEVRQRLEELKTMYADWTRIQNSEYATDFERFKESHPTSTLVKQADMKIDSLDWVTAQKLNTPEAMEEYLDKHPEGRYISEAGIAQNELANTQVSDAERQGISESLNGFFQAFANNDEASLFTYITPTMTQFLSKRNATKADVGNIVKNTYSEDIENCSFVLNNDYQITKSVSSDGKVAYKVSFSVDQHIQRSGEGKTFGSYTANATLTGEFKLSALTLKEISRQNQ
jgi:gas vesicle protein gvpC repeat-containing domain protein